MPSLPPRDGVGSPLCACIGAGTSTVSPANIIDSVNRTSLPLPPTGEHDAVSGLSGTFLLPHCALCEHGEGMSPSAAGRPLGWVDGTLAGLHWGINAILFPSPWHVLCKHGGRTYTSGIKQSLVWVNGTFACYHRGGNTITKLGQPFFASSVSSLSIHHRGRGVLPDGLDCYAVGKGDSIQAPDGHCQMGSLRKCG